MTKIPVDKDLIEQAIEAAFSPYCTQDLAILVPALRAALAELAVRSCKECNGTGEVETGIGMMVCLDCHKASTPPPAEVPLLTDEEMMEMVTANAGYGGTNFDRVARAIEQAVRQKAGLPT